MNGAANHHKSKSTTATKLTLPYRVAIVLACVSLISALQQGNFNSFGSHSNDTSNDPPQHDQQDRHHPLPYLNSTLMNELFVDHNHSKARVACDRLDNVRGNQKVVVDTLLECMDSLEEAQKLVPATACAQKHSNHTPMTIHLFWKKPPLTRVALLGLLSVLHSQPGECTQVVLWTSKSESLDTFWKGLSLYNNDRLGAPTLHLKVLNATDFGGRIKRNFPSLDPISHTKLSQILTQMEVERLVALIGPPAFADAVRVVTLAAYGGIYLDIDSLLVNNLHPLANVDFFYRWSTQPSPNTAAFGLQLGSPNAEWVISRLSSSSSIRDFAYRCFPQKIGDMVKNIDHGQAGIQMLPSAFFDPLWVLIDTTEPGPEEQKKLWDRLGISDFWKFFEVPVVLSEPPRMIKETTHSNRTLKGKNQHLVSSSFFPGVFAFHWHNQWRKPIVNRSVPEQYMQVYQRYQDENQHLLQVVLPRNIS